MNVQKTIYANKPFRSNKKPTSDTGYFFQHQERSLILYSLFFFRIISNTIYTDKYSARRKKKEKVNVTSYIERNVSMKVVCVKIITVLEICENFFSQKIKYIWKWIKSNSFLIHLQIHYLPLMVVHVAPPCVLEMVEYEYQHSIDDGHRMVLVVWQHFYCLERKAIICNRIRRNIRRILLVRRKLC